MYATFGWLLKVSDALCVEGRTILAFLHVNFGWLSKMCQFCTMVQYVICNKKNLSENGFIVCSVRRIV